MAKRRKPLELTRDGLAELVGCSSVTIKKIERDERRPSRQTAQLLAKHLQICPSEWDGFVRKARGEYIEQIVASQALPQQVSSSRQDFRQEDFKQQESMR